MEQLVRPDIGSPHRSSGLRGQLEPGAAQGGLSGMEPWRRPALLHGDLHVDPRNADATPSDLWRVADDRLNRAVAACDNVRIDGCGFFRLPSASGNLPATREVPWPNPSRIDVGWDS